MQYYVFNSLAAAQAAVAANDAPLGFPWPGTIRGHVVLMRVHIFNSLAAAQAGTAANDATLGLPRPMGHTKRRHIAAL